MARFSAENTLLAQEIIGRYPVAKSALIPLLHLAQQQDGHVTGEAMEHIAELVGVAPAEVLGTCSFYEMFKLEPVGDYLVNVCTNISCQLNGGEELLEHLEDRLGIRPGSTTADGTFTLQDVECIAACTEAPCLQVNYRYFHRITHDEADTLLEDLRAGRRSHEVPRHGTLSRVRQHIPAERRAGAVGPTDTAAPAWFATPRDEPAEEAPPAEVAETAPDVEPEPPVEEEAAEAETVRTQTGDTEDGDTEDTGGASDTGDTADTGDDGDRGGGPAGGDAGGGGGGGT